MKALRGTSTGTMVDGMATWPRTQRADPTCQKSIVSRGLFIH